MQLSSTTVARVLQPNNNVHIVDLAAGTCSCRSYQANGIPCGHAMTFIFARGGNLEPYLPPSLSAATWAAQYQEPMAPIDCLWSTTRPEQPLPPAEETHTVWAVQGGAGSLRRCSSVSWPTGISRSRRFTASGCCSGSRPRCRALALRHLRRAGAQRAPLPSSSLLSRAAARFTRPTWERNWGKGSVYWVNRPYF